MEKYVVVSGELHFRESLDEDLDFVLKTERHPENRDFILGWTLDQHKDSLKDRDKQHLILETFNHYRIGYAILAGLNNTNHSVELVRIVIADKGKGYGKAAIKLLQEYIFDQINAHRLWLDVKEYNVRARHVYSECGFVEEGTLRECLKNGDEYESLIIMSILKSEYESRSLVDNREPKQYREG